MVSVVIPAYNAEAWIDDCLDSVLSQNVEGLEVIVVNDGSTDSTASRVSSRSGVRLITISNHGLAYARNEGIKAATRPNICFVDADDILLPGALAAMLSLKAETGTDIVAGGVSRKIPDNIAEGYGHTMIDFHQALLDMLYQRIPFFGSAWAMLFPTQTVRDIMFTSGIYYEDLDFSFRLYYNLIDSGGKVCITGRPVYFYRPNPKSFINTFSPSRLDVLHVTEHIERQTEHNPELHEAAQSRRLSACFNMYLILRRNGLYPDVMHMCRDEIKRLRGSMLRNPHVRLKNKIGIIASYLAGAVGLF